MQRLALAAIRFYQRRISPHKGFCCAYRVHTGGASCSTLGYRAIRRFGIWRGLTLLRRRLAKCGVASQRQRAQRPECHTHASRHAKPPHWQAQAGYCDPGFSYDCGFMACDFVSNSSALGTQHCTSCTGCSQCISCTDCAHCGSACGPCGDCGAGGSCWPWHKPPEQGQWVYLPQRLRG